MLQAANLGGLGTLYLNPSSLELLHVQQNSAHVSQPVVPSYCTCKDNMSVLQTITYELALKTDVMPDPFIAGPPLL